MSLKKIGGAIGGAVLGNVAGGFAAQQGSDIDVRAKLGHEEELWNRAQERGLTAQEYYGSPAPGGGTGSTGSAQVLGNSQNQLSSQMMQLGQVAAENQKERDNKKDIAQIQANAITRGQDIQAGTAAAGQNIQKGQLDLSTRQFNEVTLPQAAKQLNLTTEQTNKMLNDVATSDPKFVLAMKRLTMGVDNLYVEGLIKQYGVDPTKPQAQWNKIPKAQRTALMAALNMARSGTAREGQGLAAILRSLVGAANEDYNTRNNTPSIPMSDNPPNLGNGKNLKLTAPGGVSHPYQ